MNCQDCQNELLQQPIVSADAQKHLDGCAECRAFAQTLTLAVPPAPAPALDARVLDSCRGVLAAQRRLRQSRRRRTWLGVAAAAVVLLGVTLVQLRNPAAPDPVTPRENAWVATGEYTEALSWDVGVSLSTTELDQMELDLEFLTAGL